MLKRLLATAFLSAAIATPAVAQTQITTGVIQGTIADSTGAVLPGVDVEARNVDTNPARNQKTHRDRRFVFLKLPSRRFHRTL